MSAFRYYQIGERSDWVLAPCADPLDPWGFAMEYRAARVTILAMSHDPDLTNGEGLRYLGPWYADIDDKDLNVALNSGRELCRKLINLGVAQEDLEIHLSGSKGVHIFLHPSILGITKDLPNLAKAYMELAVKLYVKGLDMQVYSEGKGRMFRPPNQPKASGEYKVLVTYEQLKAMTVDDYVELTSKPGELTNFVGPRVRSQALATLFANAKSVKDPKPIEKGGLDDIKPLNGSIPPCIETIAGGGKGMGSNFNQIALNVATWSVRSEIHDDLLESLYTRIVENSADKDYKDKSGRYGELKSGVVNVMKNKDKYKFSCGSLKKASGHRDCNGCPLLGNAKVNNQLSESFFMHEHNGCWYSDKDCTNMVTNFTMERMNYIYDEVEKKIESSDIEVILPMNSQRVKIKNFSEEAWHSRNQFKRECMGIDGASFLGTDNDLQRMRYTIARKELLDAREGGESMKRLKAKKVGILHRHRSGPEDVMDPDHIHRLTYVEPEYSFNDGGAVNRYKLVENVSPAPRLRMLDWDEPVTEKANLAFRLLLECNDYAVIAPTLGWFLLAHLKQHVYQVEHRGILLSISGTAGTGKNSLAGVMQRLSGLTGEDALYTLEAPSSTKLPFQMALSNSTTIPRVINEMNPKSVTQRHYKDLIELLKGAFDSRAISRGRLGGGDRNDANVSKTDWFITAPVLTLSEEIITEPAVLQRSIRVVMTDAGRGRGAKAFRVLEPMADHLVGFAPILVKAALGTKVRDIGERLRDIELPSAMELIDIPDRLKFGYRSILVAYDWAIDVFSRDGTGVEYETLQGLIDMRNKFLLYIEKHAKDIARASGVTEVDKIISRIAVMANYSNDPSPPRWGIKKGQHFAAIDGTLYLDMMLIYPQLQNYAQYTQEPLGIQNYEAFMTAVKSMKYYNTDSATTDYLPTGGRFVLALDMESMLSKGMPVGIFN